MAFEHFLLYDLEELDKLVGEAALLHYEHHCVDLIVDLVERELELVEDKVDLELRIAEADRVDHHQLVVAGKGEASRAATRGVRRGERTFGYAVHVASSVVYTIAGGRLAAAGQADKQKCLLCSEDCL